MSCECDGGTVDPDTHPLDLVAAVAEAVATPLHAQLHELAEIMAPARNTLSVPAPRITTGTLAVPPGRMVQLLGGSVDRLSVTLRAILDPAAIDAYVGLPVAIYGHPGGTVPNALADPYPGGAFCLPAGRQKDPIASEVTLNTSSGLWCATSLGLPTIFVTWVAYYR